MRLLKLFGKREDRPDTAAAPNCGHLVLVPLWDNLADMGNKEKASGYRCQACDARLTLVEAAEARRRTRISLS